MNNVKLTYEKLSAGAVTDELTHGSCGAISLFIGTTRDNFEDKKVLSLEYEAYEPMAIKEMNAICDEIRTRWTDVLNIAIIHRLGVVPECEASVIIGVASPHRQSALDAVAFAIEELKRRVPIWKKELYEDTLRCGKLKSKLNFAECKVNKSDIPMQMIQITATEDELQRRIRCFVEKKRDEINKSNIMDFTTINPFANEHDNVDSCARTMIASVKQANAQYCHLKVRRVDNVFGPQTDSNYTHTLDSLFVPERETAQNASAKSTAPTDRLRNIEDFLALPTAESTKTIYERIKAIENRLLYLESISPEYKHFLSGGNGTQSTVNETENETKIEIKHKTYTVQDLDAILASE